MKAKVSGMKMECAAESDPGGKNDNYVSPCDCLDLRMAWARFPPPNRHILNIIDDTNNVTLRAS
ncbi:hypothetical protein J6590_062697 [Homalodisca vitripennis]|nr:hypothetical protein J6590_062697 [Homalodisca vitripennis]